jgi:hypothetical protein
MIRNVLLSVQIFCMTGTTFEPTVPTTKSTLSRVTSFWVTSLPTLGSS